MKLIFILVMLWLPTSAFAVIIGPATSATGSFTLQWNTNELKEVDNVGVPRASYYGGSYTFSKGPGTYHFWEWSCGRIPFAGHICYPTDTHQVVVTGGSGGGIYPESTGEQTDYDYEIRSGDFDGNGRTDLYVTRLTSGPADGSLQSYVVWNNTNGTISTTALTSTYSTEAQNAPINTTLNLLQADVNAPIPR